MANDKLHPYERIERFKVPFNDEQIIVDYQAEYFPDKIGVLALGTQRCRISSVTPRIHTWLISISNNKRTLRNEYGGGLDRIDQSALAVMLQKLPDYVCNVLPDLDNDKKS